MTDRRPHPPDDGEHGVEILALSAVQRDLDEVLDGLHSLQGVGLLQDLRSDPEGLLVDHLLKLLQVTTSHRRVQLEQVVHIPARQDKRGLRVHSCEGGIIFSVWYSKG